MLDPAYCAERTMGVTSDGDLTVELVCREHEVTE